MPRGGEVGGALCGRASRHAFPGGAVYARGATSACEGSMIGAAPAPGGGGFGIDTGRGISTGGAMGEVTAAVVVDAAGTSTRGSGGAAGRPASTTPVAAEGPVVAISWDARLVGVALPCSTADGFAFGSVPRFDGCGAGGGRAAAGDARAGTCAAASSDVPLLRLGAGADCERDGCAGDTRGALSI